MKSDGATSLPLAEEHRSAGAVFGTGGDIVLPRHYGDAAGEYASATTAAAVVDRSARGRFIVTGRAPGQMLQGILTASVPSAPAAESQGAAIGHGAYSAVLTPKGRMVTDLRIFSVGIEQERLLLDVPRPGVRPLEAHLSRSLPPRLARLEEISDVSGMVTVLGPDCRRAVCIEEEALVTGAHPSAVRGAVNDLTELGYLWSEVPGHWLLVVAATHGGLPALDILGDRLTLRAWWRALTAAGVRPAGQGVFETLRVEAGRPEFGVDMDADTLPPEAGIQDLAIDHSKGCYTGQEVIVRIRDRGHVNRQLCGLLFGDVPTPPARTSLFEAGNDRPRGYVTSALYSPRLGQVIGLGYVRRELEPPSEVRLGSPQGPAVGVRSLEDDWGVF